MLLALRAQGPLGRGPCTADSVPGDDDGQERLRRGRKPMSLDTSSSRAEKRRVMPVLEEVSAGS